MNDEREGGWTIQEWGVPQGGQAESIGVELTLIGPHRAFYSGIVSIVSIVAIAWG